MTSNLRHRVYEHKAKAHPDSFTARYSVDKLGYYETFQFVYQAITREKQLKAGSRQDKLDLIRKTNPSWRDLYDDLGPY
ncbi:MAG: GIY-YIG nuclease family protein [Clostridiales bacterium]|nr:GIY-YIG nuclease family protein [Clostridiales bacterium]